MRRFVFWIWSVVCFAAGIACAYMLYSRGYQEGRLTATAEFYIQAKDFERQLGRKESFINGEYEFECIKIRKRPLYFIKKRSVIKEATQ